MELGETKFKSHLAASLNPTNIFGLITDRHRKQPRLVAKSGAVNIAHKNISKRRRRYLADIFTTLIDLKWRYIIIIFAVGFLGSWLIFATIWYIISFAHGDFNQVASSNSCVSNVVDFTSIVLFSMETQTTIGYGYRYVTDKCAEAVFLVMFQSVVGALLQAILTGLIFVKVMKAKRRAQTLLFSKNACIFKQDDDMWLTIRVGDMRKSHMIGCVVRSFCVTSKITSETYYIPCYQHVVKLGMTEGQNRMSLRWPVVIKHKISPESPFWETSRNNLLQTEFELIVVLEGVLESTSMMVQARTSYLPCEILWGCRFKPMVPTATSSGELNFDYKSFHSTVPSPGTPDCSALEARTSRESQLDLRHNIVIGSETFSYGNESGEALTWDAKTGMRFLVHNRFREGLTETC